MSKNATSCGVSMVSYHTGPVLFHAIRRVLAQEGLATLALVDNGNPPAVLEQLRALAAVEPRLRVISGHGNVGFARGCNLGAAVAGGEYVLLLNPDCLLPDGALKDVMYALQENPSAWLAGCHLLNPDGSEQRGGRRELLTPWTAMTESLGIHRLLGTKRLNYNDTPMPGETHELPAISGAFMMFPRARWQQLGGMDEGYFLHVEDLDLCLRVHRAGGRTICVPQVKVVHLLSTSEAPSRFVERWKARGFIRYFNLHFRDTTSLPVLWLARLGIEGRMWLRLFQAHRRRFRSLPPAARAGLQMLQLLHASTQPQPPELEKLRGKHVLVTGAGSHIAPYLIGRLLSIDVQVSVLSRRERQITMPASVTWLRWHEDLLRDGMPRVDYVVHCAPIWALPEEIERFGKAGAERIVGFSSTSLFGKAESGNPLEQKTVRMLNDGEANTRNRCEANGIGWTTLRPTMIYGSGLDGNVSRIARTFSRSHFFPVYPPADGLRQPVHADDLALAALLALASEKSVNKAYNTSGGEVMSYRVMLERIALAAGVRLRLIPVAFLPAVLDCLGRILQKSPFRDAYVNGDMARRMNENLNFSYDDAACDFGYAPRSFLNKGWNDLSGQPLVSEAGVIRSALQYGCVLPPRMRQEKAEKATLEYNQ